MAQKIKNRTTIRSSNPTPKYLSEEKKNTNSKRCTLGFPGGAVVKNPPANAGDTGSRPGPGRSHMSWSN